MGWLIGAAVWGALAYVGARLLGRGVHIADVRERQAAAEPWVAQLDAPLWRGTDLEAWSPSARLPDPDGNLAGAILGLAFATDETTARYWLSVCARRGADAGTLRDLEAEWDRQHAADVQTLHTDRKDPSA
jgi:hypothetical protein